MLDEKVMIIHLIAGLIKKIYYNIITSFDLTCLKTLVALQRIKMSQYFPKPFGGDIKV